MRVVIIIYFFSFLSVCAQKTTLYEAKLDSISGKYGFIDSTENYIISPKFDKAKDFISEYAPVKKGALWGIIDTTGNFVVNPKYSKNISMIYRGHFLEEAGEKFRLNALDGTTLFSHYYIPSPTDPLIQFIEDNKNDIEDYELIVRVLAMYPRYECLGEKLHFWNLLALDKPRVLKMTIDYVLDNQEKVKELIEENIIRRIKVESGEIECH